VVAGIWAADADLHRMETAVRRHDEGVQHQAVVDGLALDLVDDAFGAADAVAHGGAELDGFGHDAIS
jgi:hypothetical protein